jgi:hypothetical protein
MTHTLARRWISIVGSFLVYLVPLVGPHAVWLFGEAMVASAGGERPPRWMAADIALALTAQLLVGVVLFWSLGGGWARKLTWLGIVPLSTALNVAYLLMIPSVFLIDADTAPALNTWAEHCFVREAALQPIRTSAMQSTPGPGAWWASLPPDGRNTLLRVPDCSLTVATLPTPGRSPEGYFDFFTSLQFASANGIAIVEQMDRRTSTRAWSTLVKPTSPLQPLVESSGHRQTPPIISRTGDVMAYVETIAGSGPPVLHRVLVRKASADASIPDVDVDLAPLGPASYTLMGVDAQARELLLWRDDQPVIVSFDGQATPLPFAAGDVNASASSFLRLNDGWVVWDGYREDGPYRIVWSIGGRTGRHQTNRGRNITSAAVDPTGTFIAVSETTTLSIGNARDVVYVLRTDTGMDAFRVYLPRYARSPVVFFDGGLFGYSSFDGTHILKVAAR